MLLLVSSPRAALAAATALLGGLLVAAWILLARRLLGPGAARWALPFIALPAPGLLFFQALPDGYLESLLLLAVAIWLAACWAGASPAAAPRLGLAAGLAAGLAVWSGSQVWCCAAVLPWWALRARRCPWRPGPSIAAFTLGALLGASPLLAANLRNPLISLREDPALRPAASVAAAAANLGHVVRDALPDLAAAADPAGFDPVNGPRQLLRLMVLLIVAGALAAFFWRRPRVPESHEAPALAPGATRTLVLYLAVAACLGVALSAAGSAPIFLYRLVLPLGLLLPVVLGASLFRLSRKQSVATAALLAALVLLQSAREAPLPGSESRRRLARGAALDSRLIALLQRQRVGAGIGDYWAVIPVDYLTRYRIPAAPLAPELDKHHLEQRLPAACDRLALLAAGSGQLAAWTARTGLQGTTWQAEADRAVLVLPCRELGGGSPRALLGSLRAAP
ncbi:MAG TPA: hypothetical protein VE075_05935 [Thermoanaerobaculia bacterium]|nr:hypothetical protein [Thermoanaerobaculia bacterium]